MGLGFITGGSGRDTSSKKKFEEYNIKTYTNLSQLGLEGNSSIERQDIARALPYHSCFKIIVSKAVYPKLVVNNTSGWLEIFRSSNDALCKFIDWDNLNTYVSRVHNIGKDTEITSNWKNPSETQDLEGDITTHTSDKDNPHSVYLDQLYVDDIVGESDYSTLENIKSTDKDINTVLKKIKKAITELISLKSEVKTHKDSLDSHKSVTNPHGISLNTFNVTASSTEINKLDGLTASTTELNYVKGVTSKIQDQLNGKASSSHGNHVPNTQTHNNKKFLRSDNSWADVTPANIGAVPTSRTINGVKLDKNLSLSDLGISPSSHDHDNTYSKLNHTHDYAPSSHNHDNTYSKLGHNQSADTVTAGTLGGKVNANASAAANLGTAQVRDIKITNVDPGVDSALTTGTILFVYES